MKLSAKLTCDVCGDEEEIQIGPEMIRTRTTEAISESIRQFFATRGWTQRDDAFRDVCPKH